ncbi:LysR family transcriptional regulator [Kitasatospora paracochleata]|uniref:DNA-binding transcriptional LysR family regulator n=1 Tax=Kitasatospora paracochleata TaxID=58354 RepID=A0ABT1IVA0_9ACTN|nr:LysR family transcriptional regulator [Kitasatospora paracochleata]MCP2309063.1 DNA-binding transcriptional LysR family regulator [Kitasatospora paracochleata]
MELELRHLRTLCVIAEAGSLGRAAATLGHSQAAVSTQLGRLERHFGQRLFERGPDGVEPTPYGAVVLAQAREVLLGAERIGRPAAGTGGGTLRLAATNTPILPGLARRICALLPELRLSVSSVYASSDIVEQLERGEIDAGLAVDYPGRELAHSELIEHRGIVTEPGFVALPADHRLRHRTEVSLAELGGEAWFLTPDDGAGWPGVFHTACRSAGFAPAVLHEFLGDQLQLQRMIAEGLGVSVVQATIQPIPGVIVKPLCGTPLWARYLIAWRRDAQAGVPAETLYRAAADAYRELIARAAHFQSWVARTYTSP